MATMTSISNSQALADSLLKNGYVHIDSCEYINEQDINDLVTFQGRSFFLPEDKYGGQRFRAHTRLLFKDGIIFHVPTFSYMQTKEYNYSHGDIEREMSQIDETILKLSLFKKTLFKDIEFATYTNLVDFQNPVRIGLHHIRYLPVFETPSYSSPPWLHKDEEPIVFTHLIDASNNIVGGDSILAPDDKGYTAVMSLQHPFDTLVVSNDEILHAVTPMGLMSGDRTSRHISYYLLP